MVFIATVITIFIVLTSVNYNQPVFIGMINTIQGYEPNFSDEELLQKLSKFNEVNSFLEMYPDTLPIITTQVGHQQVHYTSLTDTGQVSLVAMILLDDRVKFTHICEQSNKPPVIISSPTIFDIERTNC